MRLRQNLVFVSLMFTLFSCEKEGISTIMVEGLVRDDVSKEPIAGISITIDGIKPPSGMGIITDGKRESIGRTKTDANGYYKAKLQVFEGAERIEFYLNSGKLTEGYVDRKVDIYLSVLNTNGSNKVDCTLSPTSLLKIKFQNVHQVSDSDFFYFGWTANGNGWTKGIIQKENCGTVPASEALTWTGKDVCGNFTVETIAEKYTTVYWTAKKSGITKQYRDSVFITRGLINEFSLKY